MSTQKNTTYKRKEKSMSSAGFESAISAAYALDCAATRNVKLTYILNLNYAIQLVELRFEPETKQE
jgi:hypothetical protein